ncbi:hypothetical protein NDU88_000468 [Pleurodeles waltl]|uniref:Uncharacterized protein n=1 Tax=Pleurodeles waltl TaxID=8319 RepID=A0AAV7UQ35_PLEWA|nr:hypothetical protein NDU88_000468 [Pleurodeles waltl]
MAGEDTEAEPGKDAEAVRRRAMEKRIRPPIGDKNQGNRRADKPKRRCMRLANSKLNSLGDTAAPAVRRLFVKRVLNIRTIVQNVE